MRDRETTPRPPGPYPLEPTPREMRAMARTAAEFLAGFAAGLPAAPAADLDGALELAREVWAGAPPEEGRPFEDLVDVVAKGAARAVNTTSPGFMAYVPGGGIYAAVLAEFLAYGVNRFVTQWGTAPLLAQLEWNAIRWLCDLFGYPAGARGYFSSGGSLANFSAIVTAREALLGERFADGALYVSEEAHHSVAKSARLAGFPASSIRVVPCTPDLRMSVDALLAMLDADRASGLRPFLVVSSAGTTNTGAVDPLGALVELCRERGLWLHVDAAYGGFFQLTERGRARFRGIEGSDSITLDPHKGMFLPYGTGCLLVRDGARLREAHRSEAHYLQDLEAEGDIPNFSEYSPELSRSFRGLRVWLPLMLHGVRAFREALDEKLDLARLLYEALRDTPGFEVPWEPELSAVAFRYRAGSGDPDELNRRLLEAINASRRIFLSSTVIRGRFTLRACIVSLRTHRDRVEEGIEIIRRAAADLDR